MIDNHAHETMKHDRNDDNQPNELCGMSAQAQCDILKTAIAHMNIAIFVYQISSKRITFLEITDPPFCLPQHFEDGISYILSQTIIMKESIPDFIALFQKLFDGTKSASTVIKTHNGAQNKWYRFILLNCQDASGAPAHIIGTIQDASERMVAELQYSKEEQYRLAVLADSRRVYEVNVTRNRFMRLQSIQQSTDVCDWLAYDEAMNRLRIERVHEQDWDAFLQIANPESLARAFDSGKSEFYCEYRYKSDAGGYLWMSSTTHLLLDPITSDIKGFIYVKDIDEQKKQELALRHQAERDSLTGLFNRAAAQKRIQQRISDANAGQTYGFFSIDIDAFKYVNDTFGHIQGDHLLKEMSLRFERILRANDVLARMGGDEFIIFLHDVSILHMKEVAKRLMHGARGIKIENSNYACTISIGIAVYPFDAQTFEELYKKSDEALYCAKKSGKNRCVLYPFELAAIGAPLATHIN